MIQISNCKVYKSNSFVKLLCICVCLYVFMSVGSHRGTQVAQSPLGWGDNLSRPLAMINLPLHRSGEKWKKRRKGRWKWHRRKMRKEWRERKRDKQGERFRERWGEREDTLLMPQWLWAGRLTITFIPQSSSSGSFPRTHPTAHRPGEVYEHSWGSLPTMKFPETALFIRWKHIHQSPRRASEWAVIRALPYSATKVLSLVCLFIFPRYGSFIDLDEPSLPRRAITSNKTSFKMYTSQVMWGREGSWVVQIHRGLKPCGTGSVWRV